MDTTVIPEAFQHTHEEHSVNYTAELIVWSVIDGLLFLSIISGNILTVTAIKVNRKLSSMISSLFILNLALSDFLVGLTLPYHFSFFLGFEYLTKRRHSCILRFVLIILACSSSVYNLLAIAADRYIAIVYPLRYNRYMTRRVAKLIMLAGWTISFGVASIPIYWNNWVEDGGCSIQVLPELFVNFGLTPMFALIWVAMLIVYFRIWREADCHAKRLRTTASHHIEIWGDTKSVQVR